MALNQDLEKNIDKQVAENRNLNQKIMAMKESRNKC